MIDVALTTSEVSGFILERTAKRMKQFFQQKLTAAETDITIDQWVVLQTLEEEDGLSQLEIATATFKDAPTVTRIIDLLCKKELTRREPDTNDRRRFNIRLTRAGHEKIAAVMPIIREAREQAWSGLDEAEMEHLVKILNQVFSNIEQKPSKPPPNVHSVLNHQIMHYYQLGKVPHKRHTQFRKADGSLYHEELFSTEGFSDLYSLLYHCNAPTQIVQVDDPFSVAPEIVSDKQLKHRSLKGFDVAPEDDYLKSRKPVLVNDDCKIILAAPRKSTTDYFFKNADADEVIFIHEGKGSLRTMYGNIPFDYGDYLVIPRGTIYQLEFEGPDNRLFIVESTSPIITPKRYRNKFGQLLEHSPFCERDIRKPQDLETHDEQGKFLFYIKKQDQMYPYYYLSHPFDLVGWDGYAYPYAFSIHDFEPITGRVHQPPPVHQTFEARNFVICSFVPRLYDYHPQAIPAPYNHSNIDSDEVLYYVAGDFMSRKHVERGMITLHPGGIPHGPHPGTVEKSIGAKGTEELAVMVDTFRPLKLTTHAVGIEDKDYYQSWLP